MIEVIVFETSTVYAVVAGAKTGERLPDETEMFDRLASLIDDLSTETV